MSVYVGVEVKLAHDVLTFNIMLVIELACVEIKCKVKLRTMTWKKKLSKIPFVLNAYSALCSTKPSHSPLIIERMEVDLIFSRLSNQRSLRIIDVGAHHGEFLDIFERHNDDHVYEVVCVEPFAENLSVLRQKARRYKRVHAQICDVALSDISGPKIFYAGSASTLFTCTPEWQTVFPDYFEQSQQITIECLTFADLFQHFQITQCLSWDFIKVDTEGHDLNVLRSMCAAQIFPFAVMFEIGPNLTLVDQAVDLLRTNHFDEYYVFGRSGIATTFIGEYLGLPHLIQLREQGRLATGNIVAFRATTNP